MNLGDVFLRLLLGDTSQFQKQVDDAASKAGTQSGKTLGSKMAGAIKFAAGGIGGVAFTSAISGAVSFEDQLRTINTVAGLTDDQLGKVGDGIKDLSKETGKSLDDLTGGFYDLVSAGVPADKAMQVLKDSAVLATGALGTTGESVDIVTSALNAFGIDASQSAKVTDIFAKTVADGKTTVAGLAQGFSRVAPIAHAAGISLEEVAAGTAQMTLKGATASQAYTDMTGAINALLTPNDTLNKLQEKTGKRFADVAREKGLAKALEELRVATNGDNEEFAKAIGSSEALTFALSVTGDEAGGFADELANVQGAAKTGGVALGQYTEKSKSAAEQGKRLSAQVQVFLTDVGGPFVQTLGPAVFAVNQLAGAFGTAGIATKAFGFVLGGLATKVIGPMLGGLKKVGVAIGNSAFIQRGLTLAVTKLQLPAQLLLTKVQGVFLDVFAQLGETSAGAFVKRFLASSAVQRLASLIPKAVGPIVIAAAVVATVDYVAAQKANVDLINAVTAGVGTATTEQLQGMREQIAVALKAESERFDPFEDFFGLSQQNNLQKQLDALDLILARSFDRTGEGAAHALADGFKAEAPKVVEPAFRSIVGNLGRDPQAAAKATRRVGLLAMQGLKQGFQDGRNAVNQQWQSFLDILKNAESPAKERARLLGELTSKELQKGLHSQDPYVRAAAQTTKQQIIDRLNVLKTNAHNIGKTGMEELRKGMKSKDPDIRKAATAIYNAAVGDGKAKGPKDLPADGKKFGNDAGAAIASGLNSDRTKDDVIQAAANIAGWVQKYLHISSPAEAGPWSKDGGPEGWGHNFGASLAAGIAGTKGLMSAASQTLATAALPAFNPMMAPRPGGLAYAAPRPSAALSGIPAGRTGSGAPSSVTNVNVNVEGLVKAKDPIALAQRLQRFAAAGVFDSSKTARDWAES